MRPERRIDHASREDFAEMVSLMRWHYGAVLRRARTAELRLLESKEESRALRLSLAIVDGSAPRPGDHELM